MPKTVDQIAARARRGLPFGLTGLAGLACAACCAIRCCSPPGSAPAPVGPPPARGCPASP
ncbi:hypothetical protein AB0C01_25280 [Micromonospora sp. NPDC048905]|uniref:hypothetical protein n=1 Tax=Micromonospora TaxID=1873 RepID=UPI00340A666D